MSYWKTLTLTNLRVYFPVKVGGNLSTNLSSSFFTSSLINPYDSDSDTLTISQSSQKPGIYYTDLDSNFLITNGVGMYGLSIGIHKPVPNRIDDEVLFSIEVTEGDLSTLVSQVGDLYQIHGLDINNPLTVNTNSRTAGDISQIIDFDSGSNETTVTRI
jgi:hypothetical protein